MCGLFFLQEKETIQFLMLSSANNWKHYCIMWKRWKYHILYLLLFLVFIPSSDGGGIFFRRKGGIDVSSHSKRNRTIHIFRNYGKVGGSDINFNDINRVESDSSENEQSKDEVKGNDNKALEGLAGKENDPHDPTTTTKKPKVRFPPQIITTKDPYLYPGEKPPLR